MAFDADPSDPRSDEQLAVLAQRGSSDCFEPLVRRYQVRLLRYLMRHASTRADAEDVMQETFLRAYTRIGTYRTAWRFKTWLFTIAHHTAVNHRRRSRPQTVGDRPEPPAATAPPVDTMDRDESRQRLWATARRVLSDDQYAALWLHYVEDLSAGEIGRVMGRSWVSVKALLSRGRRRLMPHLNAGHGDLVPVTAGGTT